MTTAEQLTQFAWAENPGVAWALVNLRDCDDGGALKDFVHDTQEDAEHPDVASRTGPTLYCVERRSVLADDDTPAPDGEAWAFVVSTQKRRTVWSKVDFEPADGERFNRFWTFPDAAGAIERARIASQDYRSKCEGIAFRAYLLTWSVRAVAGKGA